MKIKDVIVEAGLLKRAKDELGRIITTDDPYWWQKGGGMKKDVSAFEPDAAKLRQTIGILRDKQRRKNRQPQTGQAQAQPIAVTTQQPARAKTVTTSAGVQVIGTRPQIHLRYKNQDFFLKTDPSGVETFVNLAGKKVPDQTQEFLMRQLQEL